MKKLLFVTAIALLFYFLQSCNEVIKNNIDGFSISEQSFSEGSVNSVSELNVVLEGSLGSEITVSYEFFEGTAKFGDDLYQADGEIAFSPEQTAATIPLEIIGDEYFELSESFKLILTHDGRATVFDFIIEDDDQMEAILTDEDGFFTPAEYSSMQLAWNDEFDGNNLNTAYWSYEIGKGCDVGICGWGNDELERYTDEASNIKLENGKLVITAIENAGSYTSGRIKTEDKVGLKYGRIDIRARLPKGQGIWPAIWMLGENIDDVSWPACGEIDIMELVGHKPHVVYGAVHYEDGGYQYETGSSDLSQGDFSEQFHVFTVVWDKDKIEWYVDNNHFKTFSKNGINGYPFNNSFFFIMNVAVGGRWPGNPDETTVFPQKMEVDYIRVFQ